MPWTAALGKAATPQRHEHEHESPTTVPDPATMVPVLAVEVAAATETVVADDLAAPPAMTAVLPVPFCWMAICWKSAWVLFIVGLIEKVMPFPQWPDCLQ